MSGVTPEQLMTTAYVLLAIFAAIVTVDKFFDIIKKWRAPSTDMAKKLTDDETRLDEQEKAIRELQNSQKLLCTGVLALLDHEMHNGNDQQMKDAHDKLMEYLSGKIAG